MKRCAKCGSELLDRARFCDSCGAEVQAMSEAPPASPSAPVGRVAPAEPARPQRVILRSDVTGQEYDLGSKKESLIGRGDPARGLNPEVTLDDPSALSQGVSRLHAKIIFNGGKHYIVDLNSSNSTKINGEKLVPQQVYSIRDGDAIVFGRYQMSLIIM